MDKEDFLYFVLISVGIIALWYFVIGPLFAPRRGVVPIQQPLEEAAPLPRAEPVEVPEVAPEAAPEPVEAPRPWKEVPAVEDLVLGNELVRTFWTNKGAALQRVELLKFNAPYVTEEGRPVLTLLRDFAEGRYSDVLEKVTFLHGTEEGQQTSEDDVPTAELVYELTEQDENRLVFEALLGGRLRVRKTVSIQPGTYHLDVTLQVENASAQGLKCRYDLRGAAGIERESVQSMYLGTRVGIREGPRDYAISKLRASKIANNDREDNINESSNIVWAGSVSHYFVAVTVPDSAEWVGTVESRPVVDSDMLEGRGRWTYERGIKKLQEKLQKEPNRQDLKAKLVQLKDELAQLARKSPTAETVIRSTALALPAGQSRVFRYRLLMAPKEHAILEPYGMGMSKLIEFSWFPTVSRLLLKILKWFHYILPNYGLAIILLTIVVRAALHPLTRKSQMSMAKMQKLQPKIAELRKKYGDDKKKMGQEQMALFRKYGVSPLGGCLPMLLQMPVFFALYGMLRAAIELRQAGFLWVADLSRADTIFHFPFSLPVLRNELNVLPFLMAGAMVFSQKLMPQNPDPQAQAQQKIMKWMPLMLVVILYSMPSGLNLYITTSTCLGMFEQWLIRRRMAYTDLEPADREQARKKKPGPQKARKPGLFEKLLQNLDRQQKESQRLKSGKNKKR